MPALDISIFLAIFIVLHQSVEAFYMHKNSNGTTIQSTMHNKKSSEPLEDYYTEDSSVTTTKIPEKENLFPSFPRDEELLNEVEYFDESPLVAPLLQKENAVDPTNIGRLVVEGDIILNSKEELMNFINPANPFGRSAVSSKHKLWPDGIIPYTISDDFSETQKNVIFKAMEKFHDKTCLKFIPKTDDHNGYVKIFRGSRCSSNIGRVSGRQRIFLGKGCLNHGTILHELMHTAGFWHEQSRSDRDDYIDIAWDNIHPKNKKNFNKHSKEDTRTLGLAYNYNSVMHYHSHEFAIDRSKPTIIRKDSEAKIGKKKDFSKLDIEGLNRLYNCRSTSTTAKTKTPIPTTTATTTATTKTPTSITTATATSPDQSCANTFSQCQELADIGACENYTYFMMKYCKQSCNACDEKTCDDDNDKCEKWASRGHCTRSSQYMLKHCKRSCDQCD